MYRSVLVPIDISEADLTRQLIPQVKIHAKTAKVHFLSVIPSVPFYASWGSPTLANSRIKMDCRRRHYKNSTRL